MLSSYILGPSTQILQVMSKVIHILETNSTEYDCVQVYYAHRYKWTPIINKIMRAL
jgi:hypothetical protein